MRLDLSNPLLGLDDRPLLENDKPVVIGKIVATHLMVLKGTDNAPRLWAWARKLNKEGMILLDNASDIDLFRSTVISMGLTTAVLAQVMEAITEATTKKTNNE